MKTPAEYANAHVAEMRGYVPGVQPTEPGWVKLNTNENPFPPSPSVAEAVRALLADDARALRLYPNPASAPLRKAVANYHDIALEHVLIGNGCDDVLNLLIRVFAGPDRPIGMAVPGYSLYKTLTAIQGAEMRTVQTGREMKLDAEKVNAIGANLFFLTNPNSPTGINYTPEEVAAVLKNYEGIFVVDETYAPFADADCIQLLNTYPNLVIARSFSKAFALAGIRVGYALASAEIIALLDRVRDSYNVDALAQAAALAAISDTAYYADVIARTKQLRDDLTAFFLVTLGWFVYETGAYFLFVEARDSAGATGPQAAESLFKHLERSRVLVRYLPGGDFTADFLRISVGSESENAALRTAIESWLA